MPEPVLILWNTGASRAEQSAELRQICEDRHDWRVEDVASREQIIEAAQRAVETGIERLVIAGGDGSINAAVNGLAEAHRAVPLGILPLGTGNDLARTLAIPDDPIVAAEIVATGPVRRIDRVRVETQSLCMHYINMGSGGLSGEIVEITTPEMKRRWGSLAYLQSAAKNVGELTQYRATITLDDDSPLEVRELYNVILANGRTTSRGLVLAPQANPEDGLLEVMLILASNYADLAALAARWLAGDHLEADQVLCRRAARVRVDADPRMAFSVDGDLVTDEPVTFTVEPHSVPVVVGPAYTADPAPGD